MRAEGERWGRYLLEQRIGRGGMAEVFRARRIGAADFSRTVCVKRLFPSVLADPHVAELFRTEALTGARLHHPNIVRVDDFDVHDEQPFLVMEHVAGADLAALVRAGISQGERIPAAAALFVAHEVLSALAYAHAACDPDTGRALEIVHRDVSPNNILVSYAGEVKLGDFGIARVADAQRHTASNVRRGRLDYMPAEQLAGPGFDQRADLFALGVVLYETCTGHRPYCSDVDSPTHFQLLAAQAENARAPVDHHRRDLPPALVTVIEWLVQPDLGARCPDAASAREQLHEVPERLHGQRALREWTARLIPPVERASAPPAPPLPVPQPAAMLARSPAPALAPVPEAADPGATSPSITLSSRVGVPARLANIAGVLAAGALGFGLVILTRRTVSHRTAPPPARVPVSAVVTAPARTVTALQPSAAIVPIVPPPPPSVAPLAPVTPVFAALHRRRIAPVAQPAAHPPVPPPPVAAPVVEAEAPGTVRVIALPWGDVSVDGIARGRTPQRLTLAAGEHTVRITGGVEYTERVMVRPGATVIVHHDAPDLANENATGH